MFYTHSASDAATGITSIKVPDGIYVGNKVFVNPMEKITGSFWREGTVSYINRKNGWFLVTYKSRRGNYNLRNTYKFFEVGNAVRFEMPKDSIISQYDEDMIFLDDLID